MYIQTTYTYIYNYLIISISNFYIRSHINPILCSKFHDVSIDISGRHLINIPIIINVPWLKKWLHSNWGQTSRVRCGSIEGLIWKSSTSDEHLRNFCILSSFSNISHLFSGLACKISSVTSPSSVLRPFLIQGRCRHATSAHGFWKRSSGYLNKACSPAAFSEGTLLTKLPILLELHSDN